MRLQGHALYTNLAIFSLFSLAYSVARYAIWSWSIVLCVNLCLAGYLIFKKFPKCAFYSFATFPVIAVGAAFLYVERHAYAPQAQSLSAWVGMIALLIMVMGSYWHHFKGNLD